MNSAWVDPGAYADVKNKHKPQIPFNGIFLVTFSLDFETMKEELKRVPVFPISIQLNRASLAGICKFFSKQKFFFFFNLSETHFLATIQK